MLSARGNRLRPIPRKPAGPRPHHRRWARAGKALGPAPGSLSPRLYTTAACEFEFRVVAARFGSSTSRDRGGDGHSCPSGVCGTARVPCPTLPGGTRPTLSSLPASHAPGLFPHAAGPGPADAETDQHAACAGGLDDPSSTSMAMGMVDDTVFPHTSNTMGILCSSSSRRSNRYVINSRRLVQEKIVHVFLGVGGSQHVLHQLRNRVDGERDQGGTVHVELLAERCRCRGLLALVADRGHPPWSSTACQRRSRRCHSRSPASTVRPPRRSTSPSHRRRKSSAGCGPSNDELGVRLGRDQQHPPGLTRSASTRRLTPDRTRIRSNRG